MAGVRSWYTSKIFANLYFTPSLWAFWVIEGTASRNLMNFCCSVSGTGGVVAVFAAAVSFVVAMCYLLTRPP